MKDFKKVYKVSSKEESKTNFEIFKQKWNKIYPDICKNLDATYEYIPTFLEFPEPIRIQIYTINWIERANKEIRKYLRPKNSLPNIESAWCFPRYVDKKLSVMLSRILQGFYSLKMNVIAVGYKISQYTQK